MRRHLRQPCSLLPLLTILLLCGFGCASRQPSGPAFDIPALIGKKFPEVKKVLGEPQLESGFPETEAPTTRSQIATFNRGEYVLSIEYIKLTGRVLSYTLTYADPSQSVKDEEKAVLWQAGALPENDARYSVEPIENPQKVFSVSGIRVTPLPVQHKVKLMVKGTSLVTVRYTSPAPAAVGDPASGESFMTLPPWSTEFTAATGAVVGLEAGPAQLSGTAPSTTVQIIVDGKVSQQFTSNGGTAHCQVELD